MPVAKNTPTKNTPAPAAAPAAPKAPAFDFGALTPEVAKAPARGTGINIADNPTVEWLKASWERKSELTPARNVTKDGVVTHTPATHRGEGRKVIVPTDNAQTLCNYLRQAATHLGVGVGIKTEELADKKTEVRFVAQTKRNRESKTANKTA